MKKTACTCLSCGSFLAAENSDQGTPDPYSNEGAIVLVRPTESILPVSTKRKRNIENEDEEEKKDHKNPDEP